MADIRAQGKLHHPDDERKPAANQKDSPPNSVDDDSTLFAKNNNQSPPNDTRHTGDSADPPDPSQHRATNVTTSTMNDSANSYQQPSDGVNRDSARRNSEPNSKSVPNALIGQDERGKSEPGAH